MICAGCSLEWSSELGIAGFKNLPMQSKKSTDACQTEILSIRKQEVSFFNKTLSSVSTISATDNNCLQINWWHNPQRNLFKINFHKGSRSWSIQIVRKYLQIVKGLIKRRSISLPVGEKSVGLNNTLTTKCSASYKEFYIHKINYTNFIASNTKNN